MFANFRTTPSQGDSESIPPALYAVISARPGPRDSPLPHLEQLVPIALQSEFTAGECGLEAGGNLSRKLRILPEDHRATTCKLRGELGDARYRIYVGVHFRRLNTFADIKNTTAHVLLQFPCSAPASGLLFRIARIISVAVFKELMRRSVIRPNRPYYKMTI